MAQQIAKLPGVKHADCCWGRPEAIAFAEVADARALARLVLGGVAKLRGVEATQIDVILAP
jgi:hypothetical protein